MNQVRSLLAVVAAALALAACQGAGSITDPTFRDSKAAPGPKAGSGVHADNGGSVGSGHDVVPCENGGGLGSGSGASAACTDTGGFVGSGYRSERSVSASGTGARPTPPSRGPHGFAPKAPAGARTDCAPPSADSGGFVGSGYNYCPT
jgi:hypothetical protein